MAKVSRVTGGTGWHRSELIDQFIRHFWQWCLMGTTQNAYWGLDMWDCINAYVRAGVEGGLLTFSLFIAIFVYAYKAIGAGRKWASNTGAVLEERLIWAVGCCVFANTVGLFGIIYYDQSALTWYAVLAMVSAVTAGAVHGLKRAETADASENKQERALADDEVMAWALD